MLNTFKTKGNDVDVVISAAKEAMTPPPRPPAAPVAPAAPIAPMKESGRPASQSSIGSDMSIVGTIECRGPAQIFGRVEGEVRASELLIGEGAQIQGNIAAQEVTIRGRVKGMIRAVRVKLEGGAVVEGDIFHRTLSIDESSLFEGSSRRVENPLDQSEVDKATPKKLVPAPVQIASSRDAVA